MTLAELAQAYLTRNADSGTFLALPQASACAIDAARYFNGWADIESEPGIDSAAITAALVLNADEATIIEPLFRLLCEEQEALMGEKSRMMGADWSGRSSAEVAQDIAVARDKVAVQAYQEPPFTVGI